MKRTLSLIGFFVTAFLVGFGTEIGIHRVEKYYEDETWLGEYRYQQPLYEYKEKHGLAGKLSHFECRDWRLNYQAECSEYEPLNQFDNIAPPPNPGWDGSTLKLLIKEHPEDPDRRLIEMKFPSASTRYGTREGEDESRDKCEAVLFHMHQLADLGGVKMDGWCEKTMNDGTLPDDSMEKKYFPVRSTVKLK